MGLPASRLRIRPSSSRRSLIPALISRRARLRSYTGRARVSRKAATAAVTASSYCASVALYVAPAGFVASAGLSISSTIGRVDPLPAR